MEYISKQYRNSHPYALPLASLIHWTLFYIIQGHTISNNKIIKFVFAFNVITILECINNPQNVIGTAFVLQSMLSWKNKMYQFCGMIAVVMIWPAYAPFLALKVIVQISDSQTKQIKQKGELMKNTEVINKSSIFQVLTIIIVAQLSIYYLHYEQFFPIFFTPHSGVSWILYSHMFQNYLLLYQTFLVLLPFTVVLPLVFVKSTHYTKLATSWFVIIYMMNNSSLIHIWVLFYLQSYFYEEIIRKGNKKHQIICNILTILAVIVSSSSLAFYERFKFLWMNTHFISMGYILVQMLVFWGTHVVYLTQALILLDEDDESKKLNLKVRLKQYFITKIKQL